MRRKSISQLVYNYLYPAPRTVDPQRRDPVDFKAHVARNLVPEVRQETKIFYGTFDSLEARYPGLDYSRPAHRMRLSRFKHHDRLFWAFHHLRLTEDEIAGLCTWEGTRSARENFEREQGFKVRDTTGDDIPHWVEPSKRDMDAPSTVGPYVDPPELAGAVEQEDGDEQEEDDEEDEEDNEEEFDEEEEAEDDDDDEGSEIIIQSVGLDLNRRLQAAAEANAEANARGGVDVVMDPEFEQWLKEACERGMPDSTHFLGANRPPGFNITLSQGINAASPGYSEQIASATATSTAPAIAAATAHVTSSSAAGGAPTAPPAGRAM